MALKLQTKFKRSLITCVFIIGYIILGLSFVAVHKKIQSLNNLEASLEVKLRSISVSEGRIRKIQQGISKSLIRRRREVNVRNQTLEDDQNDIMEETTESASERPSYKIKCGSAGGAVFTRWGRKNCTEESELVYEGIVGGSHYTHTGGAVNPVCLPKFPLWNNYQEGVQEFNFLFGTEYERKSDSLFSLKNARKLHNENVPCAVCRSISRQSTILIPARNVCFEGWTLEYHGYLMAGHYTHKKGSMYICVDEAPEVSESGYRDEDGNLLYSVEARCGSLPCPEYIEGREITCAVCTK